MEIRLCDVINNKIDIRNYMFIQDNKIIVNADHIYDVIIDTEKDTLQQQLELFDSKEEMIIKAKAFDEIIERIYYEKLAWTDEGYYDGYQERIGKITEDVIDKYDNQMEDK